MNTENLEKIYAISARKIDEISLKTKRYCYDDIVWTDRLVGLSGPRGVGKTTLLLQKIAESGQDKPATLYVSLDSIWLDVREAYSLAEYHIQHGGTRLVFDEVHYVKDWQRLVKNLNDDFKELKIAYTGSSMLKIKAGDGDLSRRGATYQLPGLSFREFLEMEGVAGLEAFSLEDILEHHVEIARNVRRKTLVLPMFEKYFRAGYYPFYLEGGSNYEDRIRRIVNQTLESDWPGVEDVSPDTVRKSRKMMRILSELPPQTPKMTLLYAQLDTERRQGLKMLYALERAGLVRLLPSSAESLKNLSSPEKIYCDNTNLMYAIAGDADTGTARETFFMNQVGIGHTLEYPKKGDFLVDGRWLFEVGGKSKGFDQIKDIPESFVVADGIEIGFGNKIPLWLFGFLY